MRTIQKTLYRIDELPTEEAKEKALSKLRENQDYSWMEDGLNSIRAGLNYFGAELKDYDIDVFTGWGQIKIDAPSSDEESMEELIEGMGTYDARTLKGNGDCSFTGYCMDDEFADAMRKEFYQGNYKVDEDEEIPSGEVRDMLKEAAMDVVRAMHRDYMDMLSDEMLKETAEANDMEFDEEGNIV
jgi:hypothetical protein